MKQEEISEMRRQLQHINTWINDDLFSILGQESDSIMTAPDKVMDGGLHTDKACSALQLSSNSPVSVF